LSMLPDKFVFDVDEGKGASTSFKLYDEDEYERLIFHADEDYEDSDIIFTAEPKDDGLYMLFAL
ncbi:hypothetical protein LPJ78_004623, partial [Coemansia sp. RSA 989]